MTERDAYAAPTFERGDPDGWLAFNDDVRIVAWGRTKPEAGSNFADARRALPPCPHPNSWFDRSICAVDEWMHTYCTECGEPLDGDCGTRAAPPSHPALARDPGQEWRR